MKMHGSVPKPIARISKEELRERHLRRAQRRKEQEKREVEVLREEVAALKEQLGGDIELIDVQHSLPDGD